MSYDIGFEPSLDPPDYHIPHCPICGEETEILYKDRDGIVFGCDRCVDTVDAYDWEEEHCISI